MTRKDYVMLARVIASHRAAYDEGETQLIGADSLVERIADALAADNPRFDRARFLKACGVPQ